MTEEERENLTKKRLDPDGYINKFYEYFKNYTHLHKLLQKIEEKETLPTHSLRPVLPWYQTQKKKSQGKKMLLMKAEKSSWWKLININ